MSRRASSATRKLHASYVENAQLDAVRRNPPPSPEWPAGSHVIVRDMHGKGERYNAVTLAVPTKDTCGSDVVLLAGGSKYGTRCAWIEKVDGWEDGLPAYADRVKHAWEGE